MTYVIYVKVYKTYEGKRLDVGFERMKQTLNRFLISVYSVGLTLTDFEALHREKC